MELTERDRRALIILAVVLVVAAVAGGLLLLGGDGVPDEPTAPTQVTPSPAVPPDLEEEEPPPRFTFFGGRDPFEPLVVPPAEVTDADGEPADPSDPADPADPAPADPDDPAPDDRRESVTVGGHEVTLIDIFTRNGVVRVQVQVDGETHVVREGQRFARNFRLVSVRGGCANFLFGDQAFTLCEPGERK